MTGHINWLTPSKRSKEYVKAICDELGDRVLRKMEVVSVKRTSTESNSSSSMQVTVVAAGNHEEVFDCVVFACHPDQALRILGANATAKEKEVLGCFSYADNATYVHTDVALMPKSRSAWASWNYIGKSEDSNDQRPVFVSYWLNRLQSLNHPRDIFVSLNPFNAPAPGKVLAKLNYAHPQYTTASVAAQKKVQQMNGENNTWFCGAYLGFGFHEDGCRSGLEAATGLSKVPVPWDTEVKHAKVVRTAPKPSVSLYSTLVSLFTFPIMWVLQELCRHMIFLFLTTAVRKGRLTFVMPSGEKFSFGKVSSSKEMDVTVLVYKPWFWVRLALEADLGLARSYIAGEWAVEHSGPRFDGLTTFLLFLLENMPTGKTHTSGGMDVSKLASAWIGSALNMLWYRLTMDNSISNSRSNIHAVIFSTHIMIRCFYSRNT